MKLSFFTVVLLLLHSCTHPSKNKETEPLKITEVRQSFFPVTNYIKGQLFDIRKYGITPLKYTTIKNHTDSVWIKLEDVDLAVKEFLEPEIDSLNLTHFFTEKKFLDQTLDAITFSYDPSTTLPDSLKLNHWDVYIDPNTGKVKRIFMIKNIDNKTLQLTWQSSKWCIINTIINKPDGTTELEKEEKIIWGY